MDSSYTSKLFEAELSPILEDSRTFSEIQEFKHDSMRVSAVDSSGSSYGELLPEGVSSRFMIYELDKGPFATYMMHQIIIMACCDLEISVSCPRSITMRSSSTFKW